MTPDERNDLRRKAEAATPPKVVGFPMSFDDDYQRRVERFRRSIDPAAVIALLDALDAAEARTPTTTSPIAPGVVFRMDDGRDVRVSGMPDGVTVCRDRRGRVAVRNVATNRLSYVHEGALRSMPLRAGAQPCRCGTCPPEERTEDPDYGF